MIMFLCDQFKYRSIDRIIVSTMVCAGIILGAPLLSAAHYGMIDPPTWLGKSENNVAHNDWRLTVGCGDTGIGLIYDVERKPEGCIAQWYTNATYIPRGQAPTVNEDRLRSWFGFCPQGGCRVHPWAAPGTAPLFSPCGVDGGNMNGCPVGNKRKTGCAAGGYGRGPKAEEHYQDKKRPVTQWEANSEVAIKWGILANHGGGYSFRLCRMPESGRLADLTEECFQQGALDFVGETSIAVFDQKNPTYTEFKAEQIKLPTGHWRKNPAPACSGPGGGSGDGGANCLSYQFAPPVKGMSGFAGNPSIGGKATSAPLYKWAVIDHVKVPNLPTGDYVLSYRHDSEQTAQTWSNCADIHITSTPSPPPTPVPPVPIPVPVPPAPTPSPTPEPTPASFSCDDCTTRGFAADVCSCGVCGSFGLCTFSCSPGEGRVACEKVASSVAV